jgi:hypothetical protein
MIGMLKDKFQTLNIVCAKYCRMYVYVIEFNIDEFRPCVDVKCMYVSRRNHKQVPVMIRELVVVYPLNTRTCQDINQLKKSMVVFFQG